MNQISFVMLVLDWIFFLNGTFILLSCVLGILKDGDFFTKIHAIKISNIYGISVILISKIRLKFEVLTFIQILLVLILSILTTIATLHCIARVALNKNIAHDAISRRKYNEQLNAAKEEEERQAKRAQEQNIPAKEQYPAGPIDDMADLPLNDDLGLDDDLLIDDEGDAGNADKNKK